MLRISISWKSAHSQNATKLTSNPELFLPTSLINVLWLTNFIYYA